jgi:hypothetical protein
MISINILPSILTTHICAYITYSAQHILISLINFIIAVEE